MGRGGSPLAGGQQADSNGRLGAFEGWQMPQEGWWGGELVCAPGDMAPALPWQQSRHCHQHPWPAQPGGRWSLDKGLHHHSHHLPPQQPQQPPQPQHCWRRLSTGPVTEGLDNEGAPDPGRRVLFARESHVCDSEAGDDGGGGPGQRSRGIMKRVATMLGSRKYVR